MDAQKRHDDDPREAKGNGKGGKRGKGGKSDLGLTVIGIGKLIKVAVLVSVGIFAITTVNDDPPRSLEHVATFFGVNHDSVHLQRLVARLSGLSAKHLAAIGFGSFVYAALFAVEGVGLLMKKRWAEYLTIVITISFIPLEIYEIVHHASAAKIVTLVLNVMVAIYLIVRVLSDRERDQRQAPAPLGIASR